MDTSGLLGLVTLGEGGALTYGPGDAFKALAQGQNAIETFTYTATDLGGLSSMGTASITVAGANDAPTAADDTASTADDAPLVITPLGNDTDPDTGDSLTIVALRPPADGTAEIAVDGLSILFTPNANFNGATFLEYQVSDSGGLRDWARVDLTVTPQNDRPEAQDLTATVAESGTVTLTPVFSDVDQGDTLTVSIDTAGTQGNVTLNPDNTFSYAPGTAFDSLVNGATGTDSFVHKVTDAAGAERSATATITITGENGAPKALADGLTVAEDATLVLTPLGNDLDEDGDDLRIVAVSDTFNGTATLRADGKTIDFTPDPNFNGDAVFTSTMEDTSGVRSTAQVTVAVTAVNDAPVATGYEIVVDPSAATSGVEIILDVAFTDPDIVYGDTHTFDVDFAATRLLIDQDPARFTNASEVYLTSEGTISYTPFDFVSAAADETLTEYVTVIVEDAAGARDTAEIAITTVGVNDAPTDFWMTGKIGVEDSGPFIMSLGGVSDSDFGDTHRITSIANPVNGTAQLLSDGTISFTPSADYRGRVSVDVTVEDAAGESITKTITGLVDGIADPISVGFQASQAASVNQFYLDVSTIRSLPSSGENLKELTLEGVDADGNLLPNQSAYLSQTSFSLSGLSEVTPRVLVTIPDDAPSDFGIRAHVTAFTPGLYHDRTSDPAKFTTATGTFDVSWNQAAASFEETVSFTDQSIWQTGTADVRHELSYNTQATVSGGADQSQTLLYANLTAAGVGAKTHVSGKVEANTFLSFGLNNTMFAEGGSTSGGVTYDGEVSVYHNKVTDQVQFDTTALLDLANSSFTADSPTLGFSSALTGLVFNMSALAKIWGYVHFKTGVSTSGPTFDIGGSTNVGFNIPYFEFMSYDGNTFRMIDGLVSQQGTNYTKTFDSGGNTKNELATVTLTNPQLNSASTQHGSDSLTSGARTEFANLTLDLDGIAATIKNIKNPVHLKSGFGEPGDAVYMNLSLEALGCHAQRIIDHIEQAFVSKAIEMMLHGRDGREVGRQQTPIRRRPSGSNRRHRRSDRWRCLDDRRIGQLARTNGASMAHHPDCAMYWIASQTSRISTSRGRPTCLRGSRNGAIKHHSGSVASLA